MPDQNTIIAILLDDSGSMNPVRESVIDGFNEYVGSLRRDDQEQVLVSLAKFSTPGSYELLHDAIEIKKLPDLHADTYAPNGQSTAIYDAVFDYVEELDKTVAVQQLQGNEPAVLFVIYTDGANNSGAKTKDDAFKVLKEKEKDGWQTVYLGANVDAYAEGTGMGLRGASTQNYAHDAKGVRQSYGALASSTAGWRQTRRATGQTVSDQFFSDPQPQPAPPPPPPMPEPQPSGKGGDENPGV